MKKERFPKAKLDGQALKKIAETARLCRGDILKMTTVAASGHPGGSMSSIDIFTVLYSCARVDPANPEAPDRDRVVVSHGHTSPGVYAALGRLGFFNIDDAIATFRQTGSIFEGHVEPAVPGVEWATGNLGQGLSAGCGFALAAKILNQDFHVFVAMSDGEHAKGQVAEARRFAKKYSLTNLSVIIDYNQLQISGSIWDVMPQNIKENYLADGWRVLEVDGHDHAALYSALYDACHDDKSPVCIIAHTTMGKDVSFMEGRHEYHGKPLKEDECRKALEELGLKDDLEKYKRLRAESKPHPKRPRKYDINLDRGTPRVYGAGEKVDNRSAFGNAVEDLGRLNCLVGGRTLIAALDCDLATSVKTDAFGRTCAAYFFQGGVQEHNTATIAGALSSQGVVTFFGDFGVFGVDETFNQHRLNDLNETNLKLICTHCGLDVGEDGKTHQCLDYVGALRNLYGYKVIVPADANQTDRAVRYVAATPGNFCVAMGRSKLPVISDEGGKPFFANDYEFEYGKADLLRTGDQAAIVTMGTMVHRAIKAWEMLKQKGLSVAVYNFSCPCTINMNALKTAAKAGLIVTYEDHNAETGLGAAIAVALAEIAENPRLIRLGVKEYGSSGNPDELFASHELDSKSVTDTIAKALAKI